MNHVALAVFVGWVTFMVLMTIVTEGMSWRERVIASIAVLAPPGFAVGWLYVTSL